MNSNKQIINLCSNYYKIINFNPIVEDEITLKLISLYREYIFNIDINNTGHIKLIKNLDNALGKYIDDYSFRREVQKLIINDKENKSFIETIINFFNNYDEYTTRVIYISRWI